MSNETFSVVFRLSNQTQIFQAKINYFCFKKAGIKSSYGTRIKNNFQAEPFQYDFQGDSNRAVNIVNNKVSRASNGGLKQFLDPSKFAKSLKLHKMDKICLIFCR